MHALSPNSSIFRLVLTTLVYELGNSALGLSTLCELHCRHILLRGLHLPHGLAIFAWRASFDLRLLLVLNSGHFIGLLELLRANFWQDLPLASIGILDALRSSLCLHLPI